MSKIVTLSEAASIALHGMILVAKSQKKMINVVKIAEATSSSKHHVAKVFQRLVKEGFIESHRGPTGGFTLKKSPKDITFLEIYEAIEGKIEIHECPMDKPICPFDKCIMNNITKKMTEDYRTYLESQTLDQYL
ncbi:MAG: Rrf2 family transcriptional regulator [Bacteroidales bacterium]|nr:Rrf2 family transcriptional regulator [Bacteroidales bacterium]MCF8387709.1 Rrf2 family transcriptional regulator [Bacteroidales bacterium]MCF8398507.1 Rrf2 family transcriptional regulator [Bacteroidales bacterium]